MSDAFTAALHLRYEALLARAMRAADPLGELRAAAADPATPPCLQRALRFACRSPDGVRLSALLCARLRFERVLQASARASGWFAADPAAFSAAFRRYNAAVAAAPDGPGAEAGRFDAWSRADAEVTAR